MCVCIICVYACMLCDSFVAFPFRPWDDSIGIVTGAAWRVVFSFGRVRDQGEGAGAGAQGSGCVSLVHNPPAGNTLLFQFENPPFGFPLPPRSLSGIGDGTRCNPTSAERCLDQWQWRGKPLSPPLLPSTDLPEFLLHRSPQKRLWEDGT